MTAWAGGRLAAAFALGAAGVDLMLAGRLGPTAQAGTLLGVLWCAFGDALAIGLAIAVDGAARRGLQEEGPRGYGPPVDAALLLSALVVLPLGFALGSVGELVITKALGQQGQAELAVEYLRARSLALGVGAAHLMWLAGDVARGDRAGAVVIGVTRLALHAAFAWMLGWGGLGAQARGPGGLGMAAVLASVGAVAVHAILMLLRPQWRRETGVLTVDSLRRAPWVALSRDALVAAVVPVVAAALAFVILLVLCRVGPREGAAAGLLSWFVAAGSLATVLGTSFVRSASATVIVGMLLWFTLPWWGRWFVTDAISAGWVRTYGLVAIVLAAALGPILAAPLARALGER